MNARIYWLHAISPLHVGSGRGVGYIDLPIMREKVTHWPLVPGSAIKGVMRDHFLDKNPGKEGFINATFGQGGESTSNAGALVQTDARIVCLPIRSLYGTFAWVTSPMVLSRLKRDAIAAGIESTLPDLKSDLDEIHYPSSGTSLADGNGDDRKVFLEDLDIASSPCDHAGKWAEFISAGVFAGDGSNSWREVFEKRFAVVPDNIFSYLCEFGTSVNARIRIDSEKKTVAQHALWYEETLPAETILSGLTWVDRVFHQGVSREEILEEISGEIHLQVGGNSTVGMGRVRCVLGGGGEGGAQ